MKTTALTQKHIALGAKMVEFAGYDMPVLYSGINDEHHAVRKSAGIFDVSHMGEFILKGPNALALIQQVTTNDASKLVPGKIQYSCFPNNDGGIVDDLLVYCIDDKTYMLVVNASNIQKDWDWIMKFNSHDVEMHNISDQTSLLAVQGPDATKILQPLTSMNLNDMVYYTFQKGVFAGCENVLVSNTGYTGAGGFEIYFENKYADTIWDAIMKEGMKFGLKPAGLGARDTLRLEMGFCLYGNDIDDTTSPIEAGLGWITKFSKEFNNSSALKLQKEQGVVRKLVGFKMMEKGIPRKGYQICDESGNEIGIVTSGTMSPTLNEAIGMGYVKSELSSEGTQIFIKVRDKLLKSSIIKVPFVKK